MKKPPLAVLAGALVLLLGVFATVQSTSGTMAGYVAKVTNTVNTAVSAEVFNCTEGVAQLTAANTIFAYKLGEASGATAAADLTGKPSGIYRNTMTTSTAKPIGCPRDTVGGAYVLNGLNAFVTTPTAVAAPSTFSMELWFSSSAAAGRLMGYGTSNNAVFSSGTYDRALYFANTGKLVFGMTAGQTITTPLSYADGLWHHAVVTVSPGSGVTVYVDGVSVVSTAYTAGASYAGYWRMGYDNQAGWPHLDLVTNYSVTGKMRFAAAYSVVLTAGQVAARYLAGKPA